MLVEEGVVYIDLLYVPIERYIEPVKTLYHLEHTVDRLGDYLDRLFHRILFLCDRRCWSLIIFLLKQHSPWVMTLSRLGETRSEL